MTIPPTKNHQQLAAWINTNDLRHDGRSIRAEVETWIYNTDGRVAGTRFLRKGKGRRGLRLRIWLVGADPLHKSHALAAHPDGVLYTHVSSETYRKHEEARQWVVQNLEMPSMSGGDW